ncbi:MAG TPA: pyridoxamine 5'-phosphate oxidase family protein [Acidimicrobiia bacterium]|nr:pyridoxamine 5'-phosphate oxidase family protein [Acidimicrobiia bacterium]
MARSEPTAELDARFSSEDASATPWAEGRKVLEAADVYWLSTVRADGRPHVTTLLAVWRDDALYFCTGPGEQKARNLVHNTHCILTTGSSTLDGGLDVVVEGDAAPVTDDLRLYQLADAWEAKYGPDWRFEVRDGRFSQEGIPDGALVYEVAPVKAFGFAEGAPFGQTRWRF